MRHDLQVTKNLGHNPTLEFSQLVKLSIQRNVGFEF